MEGTEREGGSKGRFDIAIPVELFKWPVRPPTPFPLFRSVSCPLLKLFHPFRPPFPGPSPLPLPPPRGPGSGVSGERMGAGMVEAKRIFSIIYRVGVSGKY